MNRLNNIYYISPIFFQNIMVSIAGYNKNKYRYGKHYYDQLKFLKKYDLWNFNEKLEYQNSQLIKFINYAYENSEFYQKIYKNIDVKSIKDVSDLKKLPIIDKEMLRKNINNVFTISSRGSVKMHTGGTTGKSLMILMTPEDMMKRMAFLDHFKARVGFIHLKMKRATFNGKHIVPNNQSKNIFWRYNRACKQMIYSPFHINEKNMSYYVESLNKFKPHAIDGFFMSIMDIANYIDRHNISLTFIPKAIFPTSETITETGRKIIEKVFKCKVYDQYASSEGAPFITECKNQISHVEMASGVFEHFRKDSNEVLITSFTTHGTPLIRYRIGDAITFSNDNIKCKCGIESLIVNSIQGRELDFLYSGKGAKISVVNIANGFKIIPNAIIRPQLIQNKIDEIEILLEVDNTLYKQKYDDMLKNEFLNKFGHETKIIIRHVENIPREKSGKYKMIKNNLNNN
jgi:phenylacetate-CoA ligase